MTSLQSEIRNLALIGDRRTTALVTREGSIVWYCPGRFDHPSLFAALLDKEKGGEWTVSLSGARAEGRCYIENSAVLETRFTFQNGGCTITDWMPMGGDCPQGICRMFSSAPQAGVVSLRPAPGYAQSAVRLHVSPREIRINEKQWLYASHPLVADKESIFFHVPAGEEAWALLADAPIKLPSCSDIQHWLNVTLARWRDIVSHISFHGPFEREVAHSLRALHLLSYEPHGGIIAAATTSLPEIVGGSRNYDYRYVWLRDAGMIASALVRIGSSAPDEQRFLEFICGSKQDKAGRPLLPPFLSLDYQPAPDELHLDFAGYRGSVPVRVGNSANDQLQIDGFANVLLAAKLIYARHDTREHWDTVKQIADFLTEHWHEPDYGIWEEHEVRQYTTGKVAAACGLRYIADFAENASQGNRWRLAAKEIDTYVANHCLNADGAYAAFAGSEAVDVSAILFPIWGYIAPDTPEMLATVRALERDYCRGHLYWRHLEELGRYQEGAFLAGTLWVAQYWIMRNELRRARRILEAALVYANDLGFFAEEADPQTGEMLGNFPQAFVHAAFIGAAIDYRNAMNNEAAL